MNDLKASRAIISSFSNTRATDISLVDLDLSLSKACEKFRCLCESLEDEHLCLEDLVIQLDKLTLDVNILSAKMKHRFGTNNVPEDYVKSADKIGHLPISCLRNVKKDLLDYYKSEEDFAKAVSPNLCVMGSALEVWAKVLAGDTNASLETSAWPGAPISRSSAKAHAFVAQVLGVFGGIVASFFAGAVFAGACK